MVKWVPKEILKRWATKDRGKDANGNLIFLGFDFVGWWQNNNFPPKERLFNGYFGNLNFYFFNFSPLTKRNSLEFLGIQFHENRHDLRGGRLFTIIYICKWFACVIVAHKYIYLDKFTHKMCEVRVKMVWKKLFLSPEFSHMRGCETISHCTVYGRCHSAL